MNFLDAHAAPIAAFQTQPNLTPFTAQMPEVALDNLFPPDKPSAAMREYFKLTNEQNLTRADLANPREMNEIIWFSVKGAKNKMPQIARMPIFDVMTAGIKEDIDIAEDGD